MVVIASANPDKCREIEAILAGIPVEIRSVSAWPAYSPPEETGATLEENALIKARAAAAHTGHPAIADDTGLEVDALGGQPGVLAARFAGEGATYADNRRKLLDLLSSTPPGGRRAVFRSVVALCFPDGEAHLVEGRCEGEITLEERGEGGFGYDAVFYVPSRGLTFAQMSPEEKNLISHRGQAMRLLARLIMDLVRQGRL